MPNRVQSNTDRMLALLRSLKVEMNGAVVGAMESRGMNYALNYGVSLPTIKSYAERYSPDNNFAKVLYSQQIRELRLAACFLAEPSKVTFEDSSFWLSGIETTEIADVLAMRVISKSPDSQAYILNWLEADSSLACYTALMTALRITSQHPDFVESLSSPIQTLHSSKEVPPYIRIAATKVLEMLEMQG